MTSSTNSLRWLIGSALLAASAAHATDTPAAPAATPTLENGVRAYIDPATGKLRQPTGEERAAEARQAAADRKANAGKGRAPSITKRADGTLVAVDNDGRFMESMVATRNADGSVSYAYLQGEVEAVPAAAPAPTPEEK